ncbi:MAG TPA: heme-copper oxidase subunit III [Pyrinomonadaceae bacterium]|nr:heme-copper oxidase subunit III [Pyrinomonadaceae bacterium]
MVTTVTGTRTQTAKGLGRTGSGFPGNGSPKRNGGGDLFRKNSADRYRIGMWVGVASIAMLFVGLSSAYIVRAASATDWRPLTMPRILWLSTALLVLSSVMIEFARRNLKRLQQGAYIGWLSATVILGVAFLGSQLLAWQQLWRQGVFLATNPHSSFFYLLTATHGVHLMVGLLGLTYVLLRSRISADNEPGLVKRQGRTEAIGIYWHFMDALWIYLFLLLFVWRSQ